MKTSDTKIVGQTFQEIADIVTPTMGPKGRMAVLSDEFSRPYLTDDGVTVAKECLHYDDKFKQMVAMSMIEASSNTEKTAFDGTTLTVLLTNEFYKAGLKMIEAGQHPQTVADKIQGQAAFVRRFLKEKRITDISADMVRDVANITTKMPEIGELVHDAYEIAGSSMNVVIEHDRKNPTSCVEHIEGMVIDSGYFSPELRQLCGESGVWEADNAKLFLLSEGIITANSMQKLIHSIPDAKTPLVFILDKNFNPDSLKVLLDNMAANKLKFMFMFINDSKPDEIFLDIAAKTNGLIQSPAIGTTDYLYSYAGTADHIVIEQDKTVIIAEGNSDAIKKRTAEYRKELKDNEFTTGYIRADVINRRLSNLEEGLTKIKIATPSVTEYRTIRFKLDDAVGAVRCACQDGVVLGGGKTLWMIADSEEIADIRDALKSPLRTICANAGIELSKETIAKLNSKPECGLDVRTGAVVDLKKKGIIDSFTSIDSAVNNAASIASSYLRAFILINKQA